MFLLFLAKMIKKMIKKNEKNDKNSRFFQISGNSQCHQPILSPFLPKMFGVWWHWEFGENLQKPRVFVLFYHFYHFLIILESLSMFSKMLGLFLVKICKNLEFLSFVYHFLSFF